MPSAATWRGIWCTTTAMAVLFTNYGRLFSGERLIPGAASLIDYSACDLPEPRVHRESANLGQSFKISRLCILRPSARRRSSHNFVFVSCTAIFPPNPVVN
jgi:hypothetical protein